MSRKYRKSSKYNSDGFEIVFLVLLWLIYRLAKLIYDYKEVILLSSLIFIILFLFFKYKDRIINYVKKHINNKYIKKLKEESSLYSAIIELNSKFNFEDLYNFYDSYYVRFKSNLKTCNMDDYLLITIDNKYEKLKEYKLKYDRLNNMYNEYLTEYNNLAKLITEEEAKKMKMNFAKYKKYQNVILEENKITKKYNFKVIIYLNYQSKKGYVRDKVYKAYDNNYFSEIMNEYFKLKKAKKLNEVSIRVERAKMSESLRYDVFKRDNYRCCICGMSSKDGVKLHVDHIIPVSKGGKTEMKNLQTLCSRCNIGKSNKL